MTDTYLQNLAYKIQRLNDAKDTTVKFLIENQIKDKAKIESCIIMSQIWASHQLNEKITMTDLNIYLGGSDDLIDHRELTLEIEYHDSNLKEMLQDLIEEKL
mgnify:CR=1 FL=1